MGEQEERAARLVWQYGDAALGRLLGEAIDGPDLRRAAALATAAVQSAEFSGRPLGAANAALPDPGALHLQLWQALGAMREHRGDGHVTCLVANRVSPCESLVMQAATGRSERQSLRANRGWSEEEWQTAVMNLQERGWLDENERPTPSGTKAHGGIEAATDRFGRTPRGHTRRPCNRTRGGDASARRTDHGGWRSAEVEQYGSSMAKSVARRMLTWPNRVDPSLSRSAETEGIRLSSDPFLRVRAGKPRSRHRWSRRDPRRSSSPTSAC